MKELKLFTPAKLGSIELSNHIVMAPMTRCRAIGNIPNDLMAEYYRQRAGAGLIVTEGTSPSPNGLGYCRIPGIYSEAQVEGWKKVTSAVHQAGGKIFMQLMHTGRISHRLNMPEGARVLAPSAIQPKGQMWTDASQMQDFPVPEAMTAADVRDAIQEFVVAARNAIAAGFDGVEVHGANGYLQEQFLSPSSNQRDDLYGGSVANRCRFVVETVEGIAAAIGKDRTGIRLSPYSIAGDLSAYPEIAATYDHLSAELNRIGIAYIHLVDHSAQGSPEVPVAMKQKVRDNFQNTIIHCGNFNLERANAAIAPGALADLVAFGRPFLNNPDLVNRLENDYPLATELDRNILFSADEKGYTDFAVYAA